MREKAAEFERLGVRVAVVTFELAQRARQYVAETGLAWPLLIDEKRELYHAYDMLRAGVIDIWGPKSVGFFFQELAKGQRPKLPTDDIYQRGGDVLVDPASIVRLHHVGAGPADRPAVTAILDVVR